MDKLKKLGLALLYPHPAVMLLLLPVATAYLVCAMLLIGTETVPAYLSYVLAAYTLTIWCARIPHLISAVRRFREHNRFAVRWREDVRLRVNVSLYCSLIWNVAYAVLHLCLGFYHASFWYGSLAVYYLFLGMMRFFLSGHTRRHRAGERMRDELNKYRACGWMFLFVNLALTGMIFFMVYWNRSFVHHEVTTIAMAAYTFTTLTLSIINMFKYRRYNSPVYSATRAINLAAAAVSMLTLTSTMLTTFGTGEELLFRRLMLAIIGSAVSGLIITMAIYMIVTATKKLKQLTNRGNHES